MSTVDRMRAYVEAQDPDTLGCVWDEHCFFVDFLCDEMKERLAGDLNRTDKADATATRRLLFSLAETLDKIHPKGAEGR